MNSSTGDPVWLSDEPASRLTIITALKLEARIPMRVLGASCPPVHVSGPGAERARLAARTAIADGAKALIAMGFAGGISADAHTGVIVLPARVKSVAGTWNVDEIWRRRLAAVLGLRMPVLEGSLYSADRVITSRRAKMSLDASDQPEAVDMESAAIAAVAETAGLPFVAIRAVADGPSDELPARVEELMTHDGETRYSALVRYLWMPRQLRLLLQLAGRSRAAERSLRLAIETLKQAGTRCDKP